MSKANKKPGNTSLGKTLYPPSHFLHKWWTVGLYPYILKMEC